MCWDGAQWFLVMGSSEKAGVVSGAGEGWVIL